MRNGAAAAAGEENPSEYSPASQLKTNWRGGKRMDDYRKSVEDRIVESYRRDEEMMILVFAQWCVNNGLDPEALYLQAYPQQQGNEQLARALSLTVPVDESGFISDDTVLGVLSLYGNDDLAFVITEAIAARAQEEGGR
ncbi:hypothetical protein J2Z22_002992 [Paenibacillus forsythiae]|uniref:Uncharacterized protein n=2 Tax=Paenibacillus forsythiae TaxID=365616 RepID=A0ABU3H9E3_9BACL|nr:hypothetical protein [Paenibacillus forsythiae]